jgi:sugar fermentation stimulation protein A
MRPADEVDVKYGELLRQAKAAGVILMAWTTHISKAEFCLDAPLAIRLGVAEHH